jgi:hypothetical protein
MLRGAVSAALILGVAAWPATAGEPPPPPKKQPVPEQLKPAEELVHDFYKTDFDRKAPADRLALSKKLLAEARQTNTDMDLKFVLLCEARDAAVQGGDPDLALKALGLAGRCFAMDELGEKLNALTKLESAARTPEAAKDLAEAYVQVLDEALAEDRYEAAQKLAARAEAVARNAKDEAFHDFVQQRGKEVADLSREANAVLEAFRTLSQKPEDAEANTVVGRFQCLVKGDWAAGLARLAKGSDAALKGLAQQELAAPATPGAQAAVGEGWWAVGAKTAGKLKLQAQGHAVEWYQKAAPGLEAAAKAKVDERVVEYYKLLAAAGGGPGTAVEAGNVALAKRGATVSGAGNGELLIDGVTAGYTGSHGFATGNWPCEWVVTLPKVYLLREIRFLFWDTDARFYRYILETSVDGKNYQLVADRSRGRWRSWQAVSFAPRPAKTIRVKGLYNSSNEGFYIVELEAYCVPPAEPVKQRLPDDPQGPPAKGEGPPPKGDGPPAKRDGPPPKGER